MEPVRYVLKTVEPTRQAASGGCRASERADRFWAAAVTSPVVLIVGAILDVNAAASPTPVQIGGAERSAS